MIKENNITPFEATHPGSLIGDEIKCYDDMTQKDVAKQLDVKTSYLNEVIKGKRAITADLAIGLEKNFGIKADFWLNLQSQYDIDKAKCDERNIERLKNIDLWEVIKKIVPVKELEKRGILISSLRNDIFKILEIFSCDYVDEIIEKFAENRIVNLYKKSEKLKIDSKNVFVWSELSRYEASMQKVGSFRQENINVLVDNLNKCFYENVNTIETLKELLASYGIKFLIVDKFKQAPIDGMSFWSGKNPAISITLRHKRLDNLAFTIMHELGHIVKHLLNNNDAKFIDIDGVSKSSEFEKEADDFAEKSLIPAKYNSQLKQVKVSIDLLYEIAEKEKINPAILLGRHSFLTNNYRRRKEISYDIG